MEERERAIRKNKGVAWRQVHSAETLRLPGSVMTIGAFDGVHRGHQALIRKAVTRAGQLEVPTVVYTFDLPPRVRLQNVLLLTSLPEKLRRFRVSGFDHVIVARFDAEYRARSVQVFLEETAALNPLEMWVGSGFHFGRDRVGDVSTLGAHFTVRVLEPVRCRKDEVISSSQVRALLAQGALDEAQTLLGWELLEEAG